MKKGIGLLVFCVAAVTVRAQDNSPVTAAYAYNQPVLRGARPAAIAGEQGAIRRNRAPLPGKLYVYFEYDPAQNIVPYRIWINGKPHRLSYERITSTPVVISRPGVVAGSKGDTLVPATSNKLLHIIPGAELAKLTIPPLKAATENASPGNLVLEYYWRAGRYSHTINEIKILEAVPLQ